MYKDNNPVVQIYTRPYTPTESTTETWQWIWNYRTGGRSQDLAASFLLHMFPVAPCAPHLSSWFLIFIPSTHFFIPRAYPVSRAEQGGMEYRYIMLSFFYL